MPIQPAFASLRNAMKNKQSRRALCEAKMDPVVQWTQMLV